MRPRPGISQVLIGAALLGAVLGGVILLRTLASALADAGVAEPAAARVRGAVTLTVVLLSAGVVIGAALIGRLLTRPFVQLRAAILERARGDDLPLPQSQLAEAAVLSSALARLASRVAAHEAELQRSSAEVSVLHDAILDGILQLGAGGRIVRANPAARALLRLTQASIGEPVATHVRNAELRRVLERAAAGEPVRAAEVALDDRRVFVSARPLAGLAELSGSGAVVAFTDITELRRLEGVRRDFVANVSHELKTPLTSIRGYAETLLSDELPPVMQRQFLEVVQKNADRLHHIVDDLLDLARLESGGWRPELHDVNALDVIDDVWSGCVERAARKEVTFLRPVEDYAVHADAGGLRQVLSNLLDNALRYTPDRGRIEVRIHREPKASGSNGRNGTLSGVVPEPAQATQASSDSDQPWVVFEVRDTGTGIPSEALPRIFERFYRVDPARSRADGGTGLGLSIVKHLVESMAGSVNAESELGKGTVVRFRLPAAE
jgi:two-component system, OmpR family, phosphate regulon sensor histidine kinase PhoR